MRLTVVNQTADTLAIFPAPHNDTGTGYCLSSSSCLAILLPPTCNTLHLEAACVPADSESKFEPVVGLDNEPSAVIPLTFGAKWKTIRLREDCPWRIYRGRITRRHHKLTILPRRNLASFLSEMPDSLPLSALVLPGTHDTMAFYGWPISQCQSPETPLEVQLHSGIRVLDVRLAVVDGRLIAYHGIFPQRTSFQTILGIIHAFLTAPPTSRETLVLSIKQEDFTKTPLPLFSRLVHDEIMRGPGGRDMWFLENRIPKLGEVRGRVVMLSRFGGDGSEWEGGLEGLGIHPTAWPDSEKEGFTWTLKGTLVRTHDWYNIPSFLHIPEKVELATQILLPPPNNPPFPVLNITFFSAASFPLAFPPLVAKGFGWPRWGMGIEGVNGRVGSWLLDKLSGGGKSGADAGKKGSRRSWESNKQQEQRMVEDVRIRGWALMDYYAEPDYGAVVPLLVECNYRGRKKGEEGWE
ncbi:hypothetical protein BN946_scf185000.g34 [Trametes cinnabarina]|uniref:Phosphatidylinositol-specific phospholipase C X domain-containing protein n=1 Tax=Pycnoporus cinnabarinus TaxID=5643 RepID=A0A060S406_PYCCI|nr:hypothetical protein BN946_scf185000.g34 [Trametes cinnabarina]